MTYLSGGLPLIRGAELLANDATAQLELGTIAYDSLGNVYRYIKASEALAVGKCVLPVARAAWDATIVVDGAVVATDTKIHVDTNASVITVNEFANQFVSQASAAGLGAGLQIKSHAAIGIAGEMDVELYRATGETIANNAVLYIHSPYVMELVDGDTEPIKGVCLGTITSAYYGWIQIGGYVPKVLCGHSTSAAIVLNEPLVPVAGVPGAVQGFDGSTPAEADYVECFLSPLASLRAVGANTTGFIEAYMTRKS